MKVLAYVNHFFGDGSSFRGGSTTSDSSKRLLGVDRTIAALQAIGARVEVCGVAPHHLVTLQHDFNDLLDPRHLVYRSIEHQFERLAEFDYFINIEDDIFLPAETWAAVLAFDQERGLDECLLPNRLERTDNAEYCVDLEAWPGWTDEMLTFSEHKLRVANNPHSGLMVLSREKALRAKQLVDFTRRDVTIGGYMASAYANIHSVFRLYRPFDDLKFAHVLHLDNWRYVAPAPNIYVTPRRSDGVTGIVLTKRHPYRVPAIVEALRKWCDHIIVWNNSPERTLTVEQAVVINSQVDWGDKHSPLLAAAQASTDLVWIQNDTTVPSAIKPVKTAALLDTLTSKLGSDDGMRSLFRAAASRLGLDWMLHTFRKRVRTLDDDNCR